MNALHLLMVTIFVVTVLSYLNLKEPPLPKPLMVSAVISAIVLIIIVALSGW